MDLFRLNRLVALAFFATTWFPAAAELLPRELDGNLLNGPEAFFDTDLNITWLRRVSPDPFTMKWADAKAWAEQPRYGISGWRLPRVQPVNGLAFQYIQSNNGITDVGYAKVGVGWGSASELGHLFYVDLGNKGYCTPNDAAPFGCVSPQPGFGQVHVGGFLGMEYAHVYWMETAYAPRTDWHWAINFDSGWQGGSEDKRWTAFAVHDGDVALSVPESSSADQLLIGLALFWLARSRKPARSAPGQSPCSSKRVQSIRLDGCTRRPPAGLAVCSR